MLKNKKFRPGAISVIVISFISMYLFSALSNDGINIFTTFMSSYGWNETQITNPMTYGGLALIVVTPLIIVLIGKIGARTSMLICMLITAVGVLCVAFSRDNYVFYFISLMVVRVFCIILQQCTFCLIASWFIRNRGQAMGIVTGGGPICSATFIAIMMACVTNYGFTKCYSVMALICVVFAIVAFFVIKNSPEDVGCYPDGREVAPSDEELDENITFKEVVKKKESWILLIVAGVMQFVLYAMMSFYVTNMAMNGLTVEADHYMIWLTVGCVIGFPMSYLLGFLDDHFGSIKATYVLLALYMLGLLPMAFMRPGCPALLVCAAFGIACITGGMTTMFPSMVAYVFGRRKFMAAQKWITCGCSIFIAFTPLYMSSFAQRGSLRPAYLIMAGAVVVAAIVLIPLLRVKDANLTDRRYGEEKA